MTLPTHAVALVVVIPIGPSATTEHVLDTVDSVLTYTAPDRKIVLADDSGKGTARAVAGRVSGMDVVPMPRRHGMGGGLYLTLCRAYAHALRCWRFDALLRLDTDALVIGPFPERLPIEMFRSNPRLAMGGEIYVDNCSVRARLEEAAGSAPARARLKGLLQRPYSLYRWRHFFVERTLGRLYKRAQANNYSSIDYIFGGCNVLSERYLRALQAQGLLPQPRLGRLDMEEDHLFGLLAAVVGMEIADMHTGSLPFGTAWKALPASPPDLLAQGKKVVHSTRRWQDMDEDAVRAFFQARRREYAPADAVPQLGR